jgi:hypothetical protein
MTDRMDKAMKETSQEFHADATNAASVPSDATWRKIAVQRLARLVESEHSESILRERLNGVQADYREALATSEARLKQIRALERRMEPYEVMWHSVWGKGWRASQRIMQSNNPIIASKRSIKLVLKAMARITLLRRMATIVLSPLPKLRDRLRLVTHGHG